MIKSVRLVSQFLFSFFKLMTSFARKIKCTHLLGHNFLKNVGTLVKETSIVLFWQNYINSPLT